MAINIVIGLFFYCHIVAMDFRNFGKLLLVPYIKDFGRITQF